MVSEKLLIKGSKANTRGLQLKASILDLRILICFYKDPKQSIRRKLERKKAILKIVCI